MSDGGIWVPEPGTPKPPAPVPQRGDLWTHTKTGTVYIVLAVAVDANNVAPKGDTVVYRQVNTSRVFVRALAEFVESVDSASRFYLSHRQEGWERP